MTDRPILFSAPMVKALIDGSKTQTRRIIKRAPDSAAFSFEGFYKTPDGMQHAKWKKQDGKGPGQHLHTCGIPIELGDRLWVREMWSGVHKYRDTPPKDRTTVMTPDGPILHDLAWYWADGNPDWGDWERPRPSIHMPRYASRMTLTVTEVRVERLQACSRNDAIAEGIEVYDGIDPECCGFKNYLNPTSNYWMKERDSYRTLWDSINGSGAWDLNPWVAAYSFDVKMGNIDQ
jgi:hypothetical protein